MLRTPPNTKGGPDGVTQYLRENHLKGAFFGDHLVATYLAEPSGFIRLAWAVQIDRPQPLMVRLKRNSKIIHSDLSFAGEHSDHIEPGRRYVYTFELVDDRDKIVGRSAVREVRIPPTEAWDEVDPVNDAQERQRKDREQFVTQFKRLKMINKLRQKCYAEIEAMACSEQEKDSLRAAVDSLVAAQLSRD